MKILKMHKAKPKVKQIKCQPATAKVQTVAERWPHLRRYLEQLNEDYRGTNMAQFKNTLRVLTHECNAFHLHMQDAMFIQDIVYEMASEMPACEIEDRLEEETGLTEEQVREALPGFDETLAELEQDQEGDEEDDEE